MSHVFLVALGGGLGAVLRHLVNQGALRALGPTFPYGTLAVNVAGSFAMGALIAFLTLRTEPLSQGARLFLATGMLGGFTTFSAFSLDVVVLWERGEVVQAALYVLGSVIISIAALAAGLALVRSFA